jgi:hypothetical protein
MSLAACDVGEVQPMLSVLPLAARLLEIARSTASGGVMPATGAADEVVTAAANAVEPGRCGGELGGDAGWRLTFERLQLGEQPCAAGVGVLGQGSNGGIDAGGRGGAGDPLLVAVERPVMRDVVDGLADVVGDGVDDAGPSGAGHRDVGELAVAALGQVVRAIGILDTRVVGRTLSEFADELGLSYEAAKKRRRRAEARWAAWWLQDMGRVGGLGTGEGAA